MIDGGLTMIGRVSELPLHVIYRANPHKIHNKAQPSSPAIISKSASVHLWNKGIGKSSESRMHALGPDSKAFSLANTVGVLGGVSAASTLDFLEKLVTLSSETGHETLPFIACHDPVISNELSYSERSSSPYLASSRHTRHQFDQSLIVENLRRKRLFLERSGARLIVMPCHISHVWYDEVSHGCSVPFLHIGECVAKELKEANLRPLEAGSNLRIGVLATETIVPLDYYEEKLKSLGFEVVQLDRTTLEHTIVPAVDAYRRKDIEGARNLLRIALQILLVRAVNTVILASNEFYGLLPPNDLLLPKCTNPIDALVRSTIQWAKSTEVKG